VNARSLTAPRGQAGVDGAHHRPRAEGEGFDAIASILNREGHRPRAVPDGMGPQSTGFVSGKPVNYLNE
jgi:hypothetical protein